MSLFENDLYRWRETYFVLFDEQQRPTIRQIEQAVRGNDSRYQFEEVQHDEDGRLESLTLISPFDYAAMDISYISGEEVTEQIQELKQEMKNATLTADEIAKLQKLEGCNARFDVFHFEQLVDESGADDDEFLDPGALLIVLERLTKLCDGVGVDPQSGALM